MNNGEKLGQEKTGPSIFRAVDTIPLTIQDLENSGDLYKVKNINKKKVLNIIEGKGGNVLTMQDLGI